MLEDLEELVRQFDVRALFVPQSVDQFLVNLMIVMIVVGCVVVAWKALARLF